MARDMTEFDKAVTALKNKRWVVVALIVSAVVAGLVQFWDNVQWLTNHDQSTTPTQTEKPSAVPEQTGNTQPPQVHDCYFVLFTQHFGQLQGAGSNPNEYVLLQFEASVGDRRGETYSFILSGKDSGLPFGFVAKYFDPVPQTVKYFRGVSSLRPDTGVVPSDLFLLEVSPHAIYTINFGKGQYFESRYRDIAAQAFVTELVSISANEARRLAPQYALDLPACDDLKPGISWLVPSKQSASQTPS